MGGGQQSEVTFAPVIQSFSTHLSGPDDGTGHWWVVQLLAHPLSGSLGILHLRGNNTACITQTDRLHVTKYLLPPFPCKLRFSQKYTNSLITLAG